MHTMQTILRLGSVAETKVLTNGGGHNSSMTSIAGSGHGQPLPSQHSNQVGSEFARRREGMGEIGSRSLWEAIAPVNSLNLEETSGNYEDPEV